MITQHAPHFMQSCLLTYHILIRLQINRPQRLHGPTVRLSVLSVSLSLSSSSLSLSLSSSSLSLSLSLSSLSLSPSSLPLSLSLSLSVHPLPLSQSVLSLCLSPSSDPLCVGIRNLNVLQSSRSPMKTSVQVVQTEDESGGGPEDEAWR